MQMPANKIKQDLLLKTGLEAWMVCTDNEFADQLEPILERFVNLTVRVLNGFEFEKLIHTGSAPLPDLLLLNANSAWQRFWEPLQQGGTNHPAALLFGEPNDVQSMRLAMRSGISDYIALPVSAEDLVDALDLIASQNLDQTQLGQVSVFINAKGGMGASFLASNIGWFLASEQKQRTLLLDSDSQFGCAAYYLNLTPKFSLHEGLASAEELDDMAIEGLVAKHDCGLHLLDCRNEHLQEHDFSEAARHMPTLARKLRRNYQHIVVDMSRGVELWTLPLLAEAVRIYIVVQQSVSAIRDAAILLKQLRDYIGIPDNRIQVIVNRFHKSVRITTEEIAATLGREKINMIPNDFKLATESTNLAMPVVELGKSRPLTRTLRQLSLQISPLDTTHGKRSGLFNLFGKKT